jgi:hypothetical protein
MKDLCLVINTCKGYFSNIIDIINQINILKFPKKNIIIISGHEDTESISYIDNITIVKVKYTGFHLTSFIYINENIHLYNEMKYWLLLPDTIKFGEKFFTNISNYYDMYLKDEKIYSLPFINPCIRPTMDMGILHTTHLLNMSDYLKKIKTYDLSKPNLIKLKSQLICDENLIFSLHPVISDKATEHKSIKLDNKHIQFITNSQTDLQETRLDNNKINQVYFKLLDLYKYQRNFTGPTDNLIMTL